MLVANDKNSNVFVGASIDQRVREASEREAAPTAGGGCSKARVRDQQRNDTLELCKECASQADPALLPVERKGFLQLLCRFGMKGICHRSCARKRSSNSGPGTGVTFPSSISMSRRSASTAHAS